MAQVTAASCAKGFSVPPSSKMELTKRWCKKGSTVYHNTCSQWDIWLRNSVHAQQQNVYFYYPYLAKTWNRLSFGSKASSSWNNTSVSTWGGRHLTFGPYTNTNLMSFRKFSSWFSNEHFVRFNKNHVSMHAQRNSKLYQCDTLPKTFSFHEFKFHNAAEDNFGKWSRLDAHIAINHRTGPPLGMSASVLFILRNC